jgi:hypothetical protein
MPDSTPSFSLLSPEPEDIHRLVELHAATFERAIALVEDAIADLEAAGATAVRPWRPARSPRLRW